MFRSARICMVTIKQIIPRSRYRAFGTALQLCYLGSGAAKQELKGPVNAMHFDLPAATVAVDRILIAESVATCGQQITSYDLLAQPPGSTTWASLNVSGQSIGHCRIQRLSEALPAGTKVRLNITASVSGGSAEDRGDDCIQVNLRRMASFSMAACMGS